MFFFSFPADFQFFTILDDGIVPHIFYYIIYFIFFVFSLGVSGTPNERKSGGQYRMSLANFGISLVSLIAVWHGTNLHLSLIANTTSSFIGSQLEFSILFRSFV